MARFKVVDRSPRFIPVVLESQLVPGSFEHALDALIDNDLDIAELESGYLNERTGAPAYHPAVLLKIVLLAYSRGVISSRRIERLCRENVLFMAISGESLPSYTTIAAFVRGLGERTQALFAQVLLACDRLGLIGREMFAIDGVKLPSNADKRKSGTHAELVHQAEQMERAVAKMVRAHRSRDAGGAEDGTGAEEVARIERLRREAGAIRQFVASHTERRSEKGAVRKSNLTDNDSAKMATAKGVIQGYAAVAAVDARAQIVVAARAHGSGSEQSVLLPMVDATSGVREANTLITADAGYHSEANLRGLYARAVPALIADNLMRRRDERFAGQDKYRRLPDPLWDKTPSKPEPAHGGRFTPADFRYDAATNSAICPAGKRLYSTGAHCVTNGRVHHKFQGAKRDCGPCELRERCLRYPERTPTRQVAFFAKGQASPLPLTERMKQAIDSPRGRRLYGLRIGTVEPVFANLRHNKGLARFTLRSKPKVQAQWQLYCMVHNIEKLAHHGYAQ